jgi:hypothetical protein
MWYWKTYSRHSKRNIDFSPGNFLVIIQECMVQIRKNVVLFNRKRKIKNSVLDRMWYRKTFPRISIWKTDFSPGIFVVLILKFMVQIRKKSCFNL